MLRLLLFINITGSLFFIIHTLVIPVEKKYFPPHLRIHIVRINLILFLIPFPVISNYVRQFLSHLHIYLPCDAKINEVIIIKDNQKIIFPKTDCLVILILLLWILGIFFKFIKHHFYDRHKYIELFESITKNEVASISDCIQTKENLILNKKIQIFIVDELTTPYVTGLLHPQIYLPKSLNLPENIYKIVLRHELAHIKHHDLIFQKLSLTAIMIHWYNPIIYLLFQRIIHYDELYADETALFQTSYNERLEYGKCILQLVAVMQKPAQNSFHKNFISYSKNKLKERILFMKINFATDNSKKKLFLNLLLSFLMFLTSLSPILAYANPSTITDKTASLSNEINSSDFFSPTNFDTNEDTAASIIDNEYFIDEYGNYYVVSLCQQRYLCNHSYTSGIYTQHIPYDDGSCTFKQYKARRCKYCSSIILDELYSTTTYTKCPH